MKKDVVYALPTTHRMHHQNWSNNTLLKPSGKPLLPHHRSLKGYRLEINQTIVAYHQATQPQKLSIPVHS
jgi:hypothetical protein